MSESVTVRVERADGATDHHENAGRLVFKAGGVLRVHTHDTAVSAEYDPGAWVMVSVVDDNAAPVDQD